MKKILTLLFILLLFKASAQTSVTAVSTCGKTYYIRVTFSDEFEPKHTTSTTKCPDGSVHNNTSESQHLNCLMELFADAACLVPVPVDPRFFAYCNCITASFGTRIQPTFLFLPDCSATIPASSTYGINWRSDRYLIYAQQCNWDCATSSYNCTRTGDGTPLNYNILMNCCFGPVTLAVQLTSFDGLRNSGVNILSWKLENKQDFARLELERSFDGVRYDVIYSTTDATVAKHVDQPNVTAYYRLRIFNTNGTSFISSVVVLKNGSLVAVLNVSPSPVKDVLHVSVSSARPIRSFFKLSAADGKILLRSERDIKPGLNNFSFDISSFSAGVYILIMSNDEGTVVRKVFKQ